jgi:hypothetical protein
MPPDRSSQEQALPSCRVTHLQLALVAQSGSQLQAGPDGALSSQ